MINISGIELVPIRAKNGLTFFASCIFNNQLYLGNIAIFTRLDGTGFRCVYPTKVLSNGQQIPIYYPVDSKAGAEIERAISDKATELYIPKDYQFEKNGKGGEGNGHRYVYG